MAKKSQEPVDQSYINLKKTHLYIGIVSGIFVGILAPILTVQTAYHQAKADIQRQIFDIQTTNQNTFVKAADFRRVEDRLEKISSDISEIKGYVYHRKPNN